MKCKINLKSIFNRPNSILNSNFRFQLLATLTVSILTFSHGIGLGWLSPTLSRLTKESPVQFSISIDDASWIGSLLGLGSMCGNIVIGTLQNIVGRKIAIYFLALPHMCLWILIYFAKSVEYLMIGRFLGGFTGGGCYVVMPLFISEIADPNVEYLMIGRFLGGFTGGGCYVVMPLFISEIADPNIRGTLSAVLMLSVNIGILMGFILSSHLDYHLIPFLVICLPIIYLIGSYLFPETPQHLLRKKKYKDAEKSFEFYRNCSRDNETKTENTFDNLKLNIENSKQQTSLSYRDFVTKPAIKSMFTAAVLLFVNQFCGIFAFVNYMGNIFTESGSSMDPNTSTIIMGVLQIAGTYTATLLVDTYGRKILMLWSTGGVSVGLAIFGAYTYFQKDLSDYSFIPIVLMGFVVFIGNMGMIALTFVILVEIFPAKIRPIAASVSMTILSFLVFSMLKIFPLLMESIGISKTMWFCSSVCAFSFIYLFIFLVETKGKSMDCD